MRRFILLVGVIGFLPTGAAVKTQGLSPERKFVADTKKTGVYRRDGVIDGGDRAIDDVVVLDVRHNYNQNNRGYERVVFDVEGSRLGELSPIERPPYFHVSVERESKQIVFTVMGHPKLAFDAKKIARRFKNSQLIKKVHAYPVLSNDRWTFVLKLKKKVPVEVFELTSPLRIILDLKSS